jgi:hypothetical protein
MNMIPLWDTAPCSLVEVHRRFRSAYCLYHKGEETSVYFNEITRHHIPEGYHLHTRRRESLKSQNHALLLIKIYRHNKLIRPSYTGYDKSVFNIKHNNNIYNL